MSKSVHFEKLQSQSINLKTQSRNTKCVLDTIVRYERNVRFKTYEQTSLSSNVISVCSKPVKNRRADQLCRTHFNIVLTFMQSSSRKCTAVSWTARASRPTQSSWQTVASFYRHQSSSGAIRFCQAINR